MDFLQEAPKGLSPVLFYNFIHGELVVQAERKVQPSTHIPDLDNANVGTFVSVTGNFQIGVSRIFI